jgi:hypothetical protein
MAVSERLAESRRFTRGQEGLARITLELVERTTEEEEGPDGVLLHIHFSDVLSRARGRRSGR